MSSIETPPLFAATMRKDALVGSAAEVLLLAAGVLYLVLASEQDLWNTNRSRTVFMSCYLAALVVLGLTTTLSRNRSFRLIAPIAGASGSIALGMLSIYSIGLPLLVAGSLLVIVGTRRGSYSPRWLTVASAGPVAVLAAGLLLTS